MKEIRVDADVKKMIDARTKEFKEKLSKLAYAKIKKQLATAEPEPLKGYPYNESVEEAYEMNEASDALKEMNARYEISDMEQSKDPEVKKQYAKLKKAKYPSMQYIRQYKEVEAALDKSLPANKRKK